MAIQTAKYKFLELTNETEAITRGSQVGEKSHYVIYRLIRRLSSVDMIRTGQIYTLESTVPELTAANMTQKAISAILKNLIDDKLIAQLFLVHTNTASTITVSSCYIALPGEESVSPMQLYQEMILKSVANLEDAIKKLPERSRDEIKNDIETDFNTKGQLAFEKLGKTLFDPVRLIVPGVFDFVPDADLLRFGRSDLKDELLRRKLFIELFEYGMMPLKQSEVVARFEVAGDFFSNRLIHHYRDKQNLKAEIDVINAEEATYYLDPFAARNSDFIVRKATTMKKNLIGQSQGERVRFPGLLAIEQILQLAPFVVDTYKAQDRRDIDEAFNEIMHRLQSIGSQRWQDMALYLDESEVEEIHPEVYKQILSNREIMHSNWETGKGSLLIIARKDRQIFEGLVNGMAIAEDVESWHILALKILIEKYEADFPNLFKDEAFRTMYGKLLRRVYLKYIPFYHRFFIMLGITWFQDSAFKTAKDRIMQEQGQLAGRNKQRKELQMQKRLVERRESLAKAKDLGSIMRVIEEIDSCFRKTELPTLEKLAADSSESDPNAFREFLLRNAFQIINLEGVPVPIVLYPLDQNWRIRSARLARILDSMSKLKEKDEADPEKQMFIRNISRIRKLLSEKAGSSKKKDDGDPYEKFSQELKKHKEKEASALSDNELDI